MSEQLYRLVPIGPDGNTHEPVKYVGVYVRRWGTTDQPQVAFAEAEPDPLRDLKDQIMERAVAFLDARDAARAINDAEEGQVTAAMIEAAAPFYADGHREIERIAEQYRAPQKEGGQEHEPGFLRALLAETQAQLAEAREIRDPVGMILYATREADILKALEKKEGGKA